MYKHRMITHPMDHCTPSVGWLGQYTCDVSVHAPDQVQISPCLHCKLHTANHLHHYRPQKLPMVPRSMSLPPLPPPHSLEARQQSVV